MDYNAINDYKYAEMELGSPRSGGVCKSSRYNLTAMREIGYIVCVEEIKKIVRMKVFIYDKKYFIYFSCCGIWG